jgi:hypothetical protein
VNWGWVLAADRGRDGNGLQELSLVARVVMASIAWDPEAGTGIEPMCEDLQLGDGSFPRSCRNAYSPGVSFRLPHRSPLFLARLHRNHTCRKGGALGRSVI